MRRSEKKAATRTKILELAANRLRAEGLAGNGVHRLMRDAGLTHGGFYSHFDSKDALDVAAFHAAMGSHARSASAVPPDLSRAERRIALGRRYLSRTHRDSPGTGCPLAALLSEAPRGTDAFRAAFTGAFAEALVDRQQGDEPAPPTEDMALIALAMGGLALSRAVADRDLSDAILSACREATQILAQAYEDRRGPEQ